MRRPRLPWGVPSREPLPRFVAPMLARTGPMPAGQGWAVEVKFDGMRLQLRRDGHAVCLRSRPGRNCSEELPELAAIAGALGRHRVLLDGELVCLGVEGRPDFAGLRRRLRAPAAKAVDTPSARRQHFSRSTCFTSMGARRASFPTNEGASCCLIWRSMGRAGGRRATSSPRLIECWPRPGSTVWRGSWPNGSAARTCPALATVPGSSTSTAVPSRSW
jgi:hypothetical protein